MAATIKLGVVQKFALALLAISLASMLAVSFYIGEAVAMERQASLLSGMQSSAQSRMANLDKFMNERMIDLLLISDNGSLLAGSNAPMEEKLRYLRQFERSSKTYASISLYDADGIRVADTRNLGKEMNQSSREFVKAALSGKAYVSPQPEMSVTLKVPVLYFSAPLYGKNGSVSGAVALRMLSSRLGEVLDLDEDDQAELLGRDYTVIFSPYNRAGELFAKSSLTPESHLREHEGEQSAAHLMSAAEGGHLHAMAREQGFQNYKGNGWMLNLAEEPEALLKPVDEARTQVLLLGGALSAVVFILMLLVVFRLFISPLGEFVRVGAELERGNYAVRLNVKGDDEIGELASSFNRAIGRIEQIDAEHKQVDKAKTEFMSVTSHELRSPMTPMKAQLQMLLGGYFGKVQKKQKEPLEIVLRNTERLDRIIVDMLEMSRIQAARLKFEFKRADLSDYIKKLPAEMASFMPEKKVKLELRLGKLPVVEADSDRVVQVMRNLLTNAIKFSKPGGKVIIGAREDGGYLLFSVEDFGSGVDEESQKKLFEPFFQAQSAMSRQFGGTGLGLAICRGIVEAQNGRIWFESTPGKGTKFFFTIPKTPVTDIKPINLLITQKAETEAKVLFAFVEHLGPMGREEFERLKASHQLDYAGIHEYLQGLEASGVIGNEAKNALEFDVLAVLSPGKAGRQKGKA